jgi:hypothetical protein
MAMMNKQRVLLFAAVAAGAGVCLSLALRWPLAVEWMLLGLQFLLLSILIWKASAAPDK